ncbi:hypothetical protein [Streptomyces sp. LN549]|uniref:hypothetical protein n=1 Tax=Streptomyces sp. LN549 TaxID=3112979 RepID=UPI003723C476
MKTTAIITMILLVLSNVDLVLDKVESMKGRIIGLIRFFAEVRDELDRAKRSHRPEITQGDQLKQTPDHTKEAPGTAPGDDRNSGNEDFNSAL